MSSTIDYETLQQRWLFIQLIYCDGEYKQLIEPVQDKLNATMNFANPGDHVPEAERNNWTIKERIRAAFH